MLLLSACLLPEEPIEHPANEMAMEGMGEGTGIALLFGCGITLDFIFSLLSLVLLPFLIGKILGIPNASQRKRNFYGTKFTEAQIVFILRQADTDVTVDEMCRKMGISEAAHYN